LPFDDLLRRGELDFLIFPDIYLSDAFPRARLFDERSSASPVLRTSRWARSLLSRSTWPWVTLRLCSAAAASRPSRNGHQTLPLRVLPLPLPLPKFTEALQWPALHHKDLASLWLRELILTEGKDLSDNWPGKI
jgi:LysR family transcriptional regulator, nod-box dependent transcriptional activator